MSALNVPSTAHIAHLQEEMEKYVRSGRAHLLVQGQHQRLPRQPLPTVLHLEAMVVVLQEALSAQVPVLIKAAQC